MLPFNEAWGTFSLMIQHNKAHAYLSTWATCDSLNCQLTWLAFSGMTLILTMMISTVQNTVTLTLTGVALGLKCVLGAGNLSNTLSTETF